jgi:hypothetical protein
MNGATIRCLANAKYGAFNADGRSHGTPGTFAVYSGNGASSPYFAMLRINNCSGGVRVEGPGNLDGNIKNAVIGGPWAPSGTAFRSQ